MIGGFWIVYVLKSFADFLRDFNMYIVCTTSEYNTVNNIQPVFNLLKSSNNTIPNTFLCTR